MPDTPAPTTRLPELIGGRYRLRTLLGRGGMATVHRAHDDRLGRDVAVKLLHAHLADDQTFLDRFRREARAAAALSHPNVVSVFDWGETDEGPYLVLELIEGMSLRDVLRIRGRVTPAEALALLGPAAGGLAAAHDAGLVHRDVKPENLLLRPDGVVKVTDFGLARAAAATTSTFGTDTMVGSPHYLAPEAISGEQIDARADVYGLGIVLFECLTGRPPFEGDTPMATALQRTARDVPAPSSIVPGIPAAVDRVVRTATRTDPDERYTDAAEFALALSHAIPAGPASVDLRDGSRDTIVLPNHAADTLVGMGERRTTVIGPDAAKASDSRGRRWLPWLLGLLLLAGLAAGGWVGYDQLLAPVTAMPDVVTQPEAAAVATLESAGFEVVVAPGQRFSAQVPAGHVIEQSPTTDARRGTTVTLVLSAGPKQVEVPAVVDRPEGEALEELRQLGFEVDLQRIYSDTVEAGSVVAVEPAAGQQADEGATVVLTVSQGRQPVEVPEVTNQPEAEAVRLLEELGLTVTIAEYVHDDDVPEGAVLSQSPAAGETVLHGDRVTLRISKGPAPVTVPDVVGRSEDQARAMLEGRGLRVEVVYVDTIIPFRAGKVDDQDPAGGTEARRGDTVRLFVWR